MLRLHLLPFSLLSLLVQAESTPTLPRFTNSSTTTTASSTRACNSCTVTAFEVFLTYPSPVDTVSTTIEQTVIPLVTIYANGSSETNYKTVTATANVTGIYKPPTPTDPYAHLTWEYEGATLTYPTTYVQFYGLRGGLFTPVITAAATSCTVDDQFLQLPATYDPMSLIVEVPATASLDLAHPTAISAPAQIHSFLNGIPAVSSQFSGTNVRDCSWTKIPKSKETAHATATGTTIEESSPVVTVQKVTVSVLTQVTAAQQVITAPAGGGAANQINNPTQTPTPAPPIVHTEDQGTGALVVNPTPNNVATPQSQQQPTNSPDVAGIIGGILTGGTPGGQTSGNGGNPTQGSGSGTQGGLNGGQGGTITAAAGGATATGGSGSQQGNVASPTPLVLNIGGQQTTIAPTVIAGPQGSPSVTAYVLAPGTTLTAGGAAITIPGSVVGGTSYPGTVVSAPKATGAVSGSAALGTPLVVTIGGKATTLQPTIITGSQGPVTGFVIGPGSTLLPGGSAIVISGTTLSGSAFSGTTLSLPNVSGPTTGSKTGSKTSSSSLSTTTTGGIGDAIASGIGFTSVPAAATGGASHRGLSIPVWCLGALFSGVGALAVWL